MERLNFWKMRVLVSLLVMVAVFGGSSVFAQSQPSDFFMEEFTFGLLGGFIGGPTVELVYVTAFCREAPNSELCQGLGLAAVQFAIYTITLPLGASIGIIAAGVWRGVLRSPIDCLLTHYCISTYLFAMVGSWTGWLNAAGIVKVSEFLMDNFGWDLRDEIKDIYTITRVFLPILYAAFFGTVAFNSVVPPSVQIPEQGWRLPLFTVRF
ncbi:MAG: hypothetical protein K6T71_07250 [Candidatus Bipolaricaulota bacterium]|nr:hypothetical protein [Candidatus Bipolaricaulota bacterium]